MKNALCQNYKIHDGNLWISNLNRISDSINCDNKYRITPEKDVIIKKIEIHSSLMTSDCITEIIETNLSLFDSVESFIINDNLLLKEIPEGIFKLVNLNYLSIYGCNLKAISKDIEKLNKLRSLYIVGSSLSDSTLNDLITNVNPGLNSLSLDNNNISFIPPNICLLSKLKSLTITDNEIYQFPDCLYDLAKISYIEYTESISKKVLSEEKEKQKEALRIKAENEFLKRGKKVRVW